MLEDKVFKQWFYFRASGVRTGQPITFVLANCHESSFPTAWPGYNVCASYNRKDWFRIPSTYEAGALIWSVNCMYDQIYFAYFAPYSYERLADLIAECVTSPAVRSVTSLGKSLDGRDIDMIKIGTGPKKVWFIARQHPGIVAAA